MPPDRLGRRTLLHVFPGFAIGGAQMRLADVANHWGDRFRHLIVSLDGNLACRERLDPALDVRFLEAGLVKGETLRNLRRIRAVLAEHRPDVLVTSNWGAIEWALATVLPGVTPRHIHTEDGFGPEEHSRQLPRRVWTRRLALRRATVVLPSLNLLRIATDIWRLPTERLRYVPNGVDLERFDGPLEAAPLWPHGDGLVIGTVATLRPEKNLGRLINAFHALPRQLRARLVIVGAGPERSALEAQTQALGLVDRVVFTGYLARPEHAVRRFDLFALSSDTEQMPLSILEAMAAGLPVVTTDVGDVAQMLAAENAPFVTPLDAGMMTAALARLIAAPDLRRIIGRHNRAKAERDYGQAMMFQSYAEMFEAA